MITRLAFVIASPSQRTQSTGLVAGETTADVSAAPREQRNLRDQQPKLSLTNILRLGAAGAVDDATCPQVQSVLAKISLCRTHVMGGRKFQCCDCDEVTSLYNSCGDWHCPTCSGGKRVDFNDKASNLILPGVTYYHVVFTLPSELSELALANHEEMAGLLVGTAWKSLSTQIKTEQGYDPAAVSVLHTWNQKLEAHWHAHLLVPGEGPCHDALRVVEELLETGHVFVVDADLQGYFDTIPKDRLLALVSEKISDRRVLDLVKRFLDQSVLEELRQ